jgi:hypothetical protein
MVQKEIEMEQNVIYGANDNQNNIYAMRTAIKRYELSQQRSLST